MSSKYQAHISNYTTSIVVNGVNHINVGITFTNKQSGNYDSEVFCEFGGKSFYKYLADTTTQTISFTIPVEWLSEIPDSNIGTGRIRLQCVNMGNSKVEYEEVKFFTVYVPEEFKPEISNLSMVMIDTSNYVVDYAIYGLTRPEMRAMVTPHQTSPIKKWYITGGGIDDSGEFSYSSGHADYNFYAIGSVIKTWTNTSFTLTVEDGRGRKASIKSENIYVQPYNKPLINSLSAYRTDKDGITKSDGGYIKVTVDGGMTSIKNSNAVEVNSLKCYIWWREANGSYGPIKEITNKSSYIFEADKDLNFEIKCEIRDKFMSTVAYCNVLGDSKDFNIVDGGGGAAIGTKATKGYFDVAHNSRFQKSVYANEFISSKKGLVSTGTGSKGDFLSFGEATQLITYTTPGGATYYADFNECTNLGIYGVYSNDDASGYEWQRVMNMPCEKAGTLRVFNATGNIQSFATEQYLMQEYVVYDGSATYRRCLSKVRDSSDVAWPMNWTYGPWECYAGVEKGTSGIWTYEKWADGKAICYGTKAWEQVTVNIPWGNLYESTNFYEVYPAGLFVDTPICFCELYANGGVMKETVNYGDRNRTPDVFFVRPNVDAMSYPKIHFYAVGRWK